MYSLAVFDLLDVAQMWKQGHPPSAGGSLDQPSYLRELVKFIWAQENSHDAEAMRKLKT
jgi:hypothetical protein